MGLRQLRRRPVHPSRTRQQQRSVKQLSRAESRGSGSRLGRGILAWTSIHPLDGLSSRRRGLSCLENDMAQQRLEADRTECARAAPHNTGRRSLADAGPSSRPEPERDGRLVQGTFWRRGQRGRRRFGQEQRHKPRISVARITADPEKTKARRGRRCDGLRMLTSAWEEGGWRRIEIDREEEDDLDDGDVALRTRTRKRAYCRSAMHRHMNETVSTGRPGPNPSAD